MVFVKIVNYSVCRDNKETKPPEPLSSSNNNYEMQDLVVECSLTIRCTGRVAVIILEVEN